MVPFLLFLSLYGVTSFLFIGARGYLFSGRGDVIRRGWWRHAQGCSRCPASSSGRRRTGTAWTPRQPPPPCWHSVTWPAHVRAPGTAPGWPTALHAHINIHKQKPTQPKCNFNWALQYVLKAFLKHKWHTYNMKNERVNEWMRSYNGVWGDLIVPGCPGFGC